MGHSPAPFEMNPFPPEKANGLYDAEGQYFGELWFFGQDTDEANARLFLAAPELLEAAREAERAIRLLMPEEAWLAITQSPYYMEWVKARIHLEEAIAKAEGR